MQHLYHVFIDTTIRDARVPKITSSGRVESSRKFLSAAGQNSESLSTHKHIRVLLFQNSIFDSKHNLFVRVCKIPKMLGIQCSGQIGKRSGRIEQVPKIP